MMDENDDLFDEPIPTKLIRVIKNKTRLKVFYCNDHDNHWPVGSASVIIAPNIVEAYKLLDTELVKHGLKGFHDEPYTLTEADMSTPMAIVLWDGNY